MFTKRGSRRLQWPWRVSAVAVLAAACSSSPSQLVDDDDHGARPPPPWPCRRPPSRPRPPTPPSPPPCRRPSRSKGTLNIALDATYAPDEMIAPNGTTIIGMDADFAYAITQILGLKANLINATFDTIIPGLQ